VDVFGQTRSRFKRDHALITPDTHVASPLIKWTGASAFIHISPEMGSRFLQYTAHLEKGGCSAAAGEGVQRFVYVESGEVGLTLDRPITLGDGGYAYLPPDSDVTFEANRETVLTVFEKDYVPIPDHAVPHAVTGNASDVEGEPFMGDPDARLQTLLSIEPEFDMAVNIFTYQPGATLPQVEIHVMEHGLKMIGGQGVYRLSDSYYPVAAGDVIWMASFCPQWFVAMGKQPARYIYYKDIHRDQLGAKF